MPKTIERGDLYFFYRTKIDVDQAKSIADIQRLHLILAPDGQDHARLFVVGKKQMPEIIKGESRSTERVWFMTYSVNDPKAIGRELRPVAYKTETRGNQEQSEAIPVGAGRYEIIERNDSTQLAYHLDQPKKPGKAQKELGILPEASYVVSVRNPKVNVPGFPNDKPEYPKKIMETFGDERWIMVNDPKLLDYENAQLLLIGAHKSLKEIDLKIPGKSNLFQTLGLKKEEWPLESLENGEFAQVQHKPEATEPRGDPSKGGKAGGAQAVKSASAAGVTHALKGIEFPKQHDELVDYAQEHHAKQEIVELLKELPKKEFQTMADVAKEIGRVTS